jgi:dTDP-4-amino-4,6-dideoxygalactose transaminase
VVHYGGYACDMPAIMEIAREHGLVVIEDTAHAPGASLEGRKLGTWGQSGCFSFFSNKNMATGEGGMLTTDDEVVATKLRLLRSHGMTSLTLDRHQGRAYSYDVIELGYNYRIDEMRSALGRVQLGKLERNNQIRRERTVLYHQLLAERCPALRLPFREHPGLSAAHLLPILLPPGTPREAFMAAMKARGIQTSVHFPPIHCFSAYRECYPQPPGKLERTEALGARQVTLPLYPALSAADVRLVVEAVRESLACI